jgi:pantetheine-phosphate adenylyltransferase
MKIAVYPGSFNPWHAGHEDILQKALTIFDHVVIAQGVNSGKSISERERLPMSIKVKWGNRVQFAAYDGLLKDFLENQKVDAVVKGLRNSIDFEYEKTQLYWNEDLGISVPTVFIMADRKLVHVSSSALRQLEKFKQ